MHTNVLPGNANKALAKLKQIDLISKHFYLTGGTSLALQVGHRESEDLDFFNQEDFKPELIQKELETIGKLESVEIGKGTLNCFLGGIKLQFLHYPYPLLKPKIDWKGIQISSKLDIACTKLITISSRGSKKDFIDMYFLLDDYSLQTLFKKLKEKYPKTGYNETHLLKSLVYFTDADSQPMPRMHKKVSWKEVKKEIVNKVRLFEI